MFEELLYHFDLFFLISMFFSFSVFPTFRLFGSSSVVKVQIKYRHSACIMVGSSGLEPPTSRLSGVCSNLLSYKPVFTAKAVVEISGFEPLTPCLQSRCSTNWAIPPCFKRCLKKAPWKLHSDNSRVLFLWKSIYIDYRPEFRLFVKTILIL